MLEITAENILNTIDNIYPRTETMVYEVLHEKYPEIDISIPSAEGYVYNITDMSVFKEFVNKLLEQTTQEGRDTFLKQYLQLSHNFLDFVNEEWKLDVLKEIEEDRDKLRVIESLDEKDRLIHAMGLKDFGLRVQVYENLSPEYIIDYLKECPGNYEPVLVLRVEEVNKLFDEIKDEKYKAYILLRLGLSMNDVNMFYNINIQDEFCKRKLTEYGDKREDATIENITRQIDEYFAHKAKIGEIANEKERAGYIAKLDDNDMKLSLLQEVKDSVNRDEIIQSLNCSIDPNLVDMVMLTQKMIHEFLRDTYYPESIPRKMQEILEIGFNSTDVLYSELEKGTNGTVYHVNDKILINSRRRFQPDRILGYLCHEYAHRFINIDFKKYPIKINQTVEEGNADVFAEIVINHYLEKHKEIGLGINLETPYIIHSGYDFENGWVRSLLYPLEKDNLDKKAITNYIFGSKGKYLEMVLGKEYAENRVMTVTGIPVDVPITYSQLYNAHSEEFHGINKESMYYRRNFILPAFIIQEKVEEKTEIQIYELGNRQFNEIFMSDKYFDGKMLGEIDSEEMEEFLELINASNCNRHSFFTGLYTFLDKKFEELPEEYKKEYSSNILANVFAIINKGNITKFGDASEDVILELIDYQIDKIENGIELEEALKVKELMDKGIGFSISNDEQRALLEDSLSFLRSKIETPDIAAISTNMQAVKNMAINAGIATSELQETMALLHPPNEREEERFQ